MILLRLDLWGNGTDLAWCTERRAVKEVEVRLADLPRLWGWDVGSHIHQVLERSDHRACRIIIVCVVS